MSSKTQWILLTNRGAFVACGESAVRAAKRFLKSRPQEDLELWAIARREIISIPPTEANQVPYMIAVNQNTAAIQAALEAGARKEAGK